jgi:hypothetical protein
VVGCAAAGARPNEVESSSDPVVRNVEPDVIDLLWVEGVCGDSAIVEVDGDPTGLSVIIKIVKVPLPTGPIPVECPAMGQGYRLTLTLAVPVDAANVFATRVEVR